MDRDLHHQTVQRALELGRGTDPAVLPERVELLRFPSTEVRRLAASAIPKLAPFGADPVAAIPALLPVALRDAHPQVQQYAHKALKCFGHHAAAHLADLDDLTNNPRAKDYRYDERYRILSGHAIRPDFYLPELDGYIEYWGMDTADYKIGMLKKQQLYQQEGKRLISIHPPDKAHLDTILRRKLSLFGYTIPPA
jgi:hypothetical protein